jgi:hypothetical protein
VNLPGHEFSDFSEVDPVFVTKGQISEQIADAGNASLFKQSRASRTHTA